MSLVTSAECTVPRARLPTPRRGVYRRPVAADFIHRWVPGSGRTLLLLHGTGGSEEDLLPLGTALDPSASLLSPRGQVLEQGMARFFRRLAEGIFDHDDLVRRTHDLAAFVRASAERHGFDAGSVIAAGFSNGANIAASLLLLHPGLLRAAILLSPMVPFESEKPPALAGTRVFIGAGRADPISPAAQAQRLADLLGASGADVTLHWHPGGHALAQSEVSAAREWLGKD